MPWTVSQLGGLLQRHGDFLATADEALENRQYHLLSSDAVIPQKLDLPLALQTANTRVIECLNADWSSLEELDGPVVAYLDQLCEVFENIHGAHAAALSVFRASSETGQPYTLYLRSFSQVGNAVYAGEAGRAVAFVNDERLDRNVAAALAQHADEFHPVTCAHTDDLALLEGRWFLPAFRCHEHTWKNVVRTAINGSTVIVFYVSDAAAGVRYELDAIVSSGLASRTLLLHADEHGGAVEGYDGFAAMLPLSKAVGRGGSEGEFRLSSEFLAIMHDVWRSGHQPTRIPAWLTDFPCCIVDPNVPDESAARYDLAHSFFVTPTNITAFFFYASGFPDAYEIWNRVARGLSREKRAPSRTDVASLHRALIMGSLGAASLGLVESLACLVALRTLFAGIIVESDPRRRALRKKRFLQLFDIADRFDALSVRHFWRPQIAKWRKAIEEDSFS